MDSLESLFTTLHDRRRLVGTVVVCVLVGALITAFLVPVPLGGSDEGEALESKPFGPEGSYTAESTITRTGSAGYLFPSLTGDSGPFVVSTADWEYTETTTVAHNASYGITQSVTNMSVESPAAETRTLRVETYDKGELRYQRVTANQASIVDAEGTRCADSPCVSHRVSPTEMYRVYFAEDRDAPRSNPTSSLRTSEFALQQVDGRYEFVKTAPVLSIDGAVTTNDAGAITELNGTLTRIPQTAITSDGDRRELAHEGSLALGPKLLGPRLTVTVNASSSPGADVPLEQPEWVTEMERHLANGA